MREWWVTDLIRVGLLGVVAGALLTLAVDVGRIADQDEQQTVTTSHSPCSRPTGGK